GPFRTADQVEISKTDARTLGLDAPIKESGDITGTNGCVITGPCGEITISQGVIVAKRHIHVTTMQAKELNVCDKEIVGVKVETDERSLIFGDVVVRVRDDFDAAMHIDTDEANAANLGMGVMGEIVKF
ncbi:MAG: PduL/EutD family phosphate acyltransferase, partial [Clostridia bacterium]